MKKKQTIIVCGVLFLLVAVFCIKDTFSSYSEISKSRETIEKLEIRKKKLVRENNKIRMKIDRFSKDPKAAEEILRVKYKMLRKDQYKYIPEK